MNASLSPNRIVNMASAFYDSCILFAASELGIFERLNELGGADAACLAENLGLDRRCTRLLLDACVALELLLKEQSVYRNTPETVAFLLPGSPASLSKAIRYNVDVYPVWGKLSEMVKTGNPVEKPEIHLGEDPERTYQFVMAMHGRAKWLGQAVVPSIKLGGMEKILDVGGGPGTFSVLLAREYPEATFTVLDLPEVAKIARMLIEKEGMQDRVRTISGDYHETEFPSGYDAVNILGVLHQESAESIKEILKKAGRALKSGGLVHILDVMTDSSRAVPKFSALFAVNMALTTKDGWVFSDAELQEWLREAAFENIKCTPLPPPMPHWLATAVKG